MNHVTIDVEIRSRTSATNVEEMSTECLSSSRFAVTTIDNRVWSEFKDVAQAHAPVPDVKIFEVALKGRPCRD